MRSLLVGGLGARRHGSVEPFARNGRAIADRKDVGIAGRPQRRFGNELIGAVDLEPVEICQDVRPLHARRPDGELRGHS